MGTKINLIGQEFGNLKVISEHPERQNGSVAWFCQCRCDKQVIVKSVNLVNKITTSCGCLLKAKETNLIGLVSGKLTVIAEETGEFKIKKRKTWKCLCACNNIVYLATNRLTVAKQASCGKAECVDKKKPQEDLVGTIFGKLTIIAPEFGENRKRSFTWQCKCECDKITYVTTDTLKSGHTKSCGCGELENKIANCANGREQRTENRKDPKIVLAKWIFNEKYADGDLTFEDFYEMSQQNCFYCDIAPSNDLKFSSKKYTQEYREASRFIYNGLDRKDPSKLHTKENCVTCCWVCNSGKLNFEFDNFINKFKQVHNINILGRKEVIIPNDIKQYLFDNGIYRNNAFSFNSKPVVLTLVGRALEKRFYGRKAKAAKLKYNDGDLTFDQFCFLILQPCHYCGLNSSNAVKYINEINIISYFKINGLDRMNNDEAHTLSNSVPCCKFCNYAKRKRSYQEFIDWAEKAYHNLKSKNIIK